MGMQLFGVYHESLSMALHRVSAITHNLLPPPHCLLLFAHTLIPSLPHAWV